ncbi:MAG: OmpA family protein [Acidobacteria bacterium]|nr:OmpA family protein [Acidobacteriota bacterium]
MRNARVLGRVATGWLIFAGLLVGSGQAQAPGESAPIYRITVVERTATAVNYRHRGGATKVDFRGTELLPMARGEAKVESKQGYIEIEVEFDDLRPATQFGPEYLTYVMWAVTPEGRATNLGEVLLNGTKSKLNVTTELQSFALIVTAEPHFAVTRPSNLVVMENILRDDTRGRIEAVQAKYELLERGQYTAEIDRSMLVPLRLDPKVPLELHEAQNAVRIAQWNAADRYAADTLQKAVAQLRQAEDLQARKKGKKEVVMMAREAAQTAEDARMVAVKRRIEEQLAQERAAAAEREAHAKAQAEAEVRMRTQAEADRAAAERLRQESQMAADLAVRQRVEAEAARAAALAQQQASQAEAERARLEQQAARAEAERARLTAEEANRLRQQAEDERAQLRSQLLQQLNLILETRDTARGLIVNMSDVLFDTGIYTLRPGAREKLAKISGIVLAHPGLQLEVEGHTDSVGSDEYNQRLSEQRADAVRSFLVQQGVSNNVVVARGFGESSPVTSNDTSAGRQQNRRVEMVVSGEVIGTTMGLSSPSAR